MLGRIIKDILLNLPTALFKRRTINCMLFQVMITSLAKEVMFLVALVSLSVCQSVCLFVCLWTTILKKL